MSNTQAGRIDAGIQTGGSPSAWGSLVSLAGLTLALSVIGAAVAGYLTYTHYDEGALVCAVGGGCHTVQESSYATLGPIPIAMLGLGMFLTLGALALVRIMNWSIISGETANMAAWGITLTALLYYAYLVYVELFVLEAICQWCVVTTIVTVAIFTTESFGLRKSLAFDDELIDD